jgi:HD superfamily phosphohydrolase
LNLLQREDKLYGDRLPYEGLDPIILEVIETPVFQRLFGITHGGLKSDAVHKFDFSKISQSHNRGDHSASAALLANHLFREGEVAIDRMHFVLAALLHDLGHSAYSHLGELATGLCHKDYTKQLISEDEDLVKIWQRHGIDPEVIIGAALEKTPGNPITVERRSGKMSIDHLNNTPYDTYLRLGNLKAKEIATKLLNETYIKKGSIYVRNVAEEIRGQFTILSIDQNLSLVFDPIEMLLDAAAIDYVRKLIQAEILEAADLLKSQEDVHRKITSKEATEEFQTEWLRLTQRIQQLDRETVKEYFSHTAKFDESATNSPQTRIVRDTYLMTLPTEQQPGRLAVFNQFEIYICGTYTFDFEKLDTQE